MAFKFNSLVPPFELIGSGTASGEKSNVLTYGADSTGVADSTEAFKKAGEEGGGLIYAPPGTYLIAGELELKGKTLYGAGPSATVLKKTTAATGMLKISSVGTGEIANLTIENTASPPTSGSSILLSGAGGGVTVPATIRNVDIINAFNGIEITGPTAVVTLIEANVRGWQNNGYLFHDGVDIVTATNCYVINQIGGVTQYKGSCLGLLSTTELVEGLDFSNCFFLGGEYGLFTSKGTGILGSSLFSNCFWDSYKGPVGKAGILLEGVTQTMFVNCWFSPEVSSGSGVFMTDVGNINFTSCVIPKAGEHGLVITAAGESEQIAIISCQWLSPSELEGSPEIYDAIHVVENTRRLSIIGNTLGSGKRGGGAGRYGIFIGPTAVTEYTLLANRAVAGRAIINDNSLTNRKYVIGNQQALATPTGNSGKLAEAGAAAVKPTANTAIAGTVFNLTGSKAKGFVNGAIVSFKALTAGVTNPKTGVSYFVIGEATNSFELTTSLAPTAFKPTSNTAVAGTVFNLTGSKAKGFVNGSPVKVTAVTAGVTNPKTTTTYFVVGEAANSFELSATIAGAAIKVEGHELETATTEFLLESAAIAVAGHELETATTEITLEGAAADKTLHTRVTLSGEVEAEKTPEIKVTIEGLEAGKVTPAKSTAAQVVPLGSYDLLPTGTWKVKEVAGLAKVFASTATLNA